MRVKLAVLIVALVIIVVVMHWIASEYLAILIDVIVKPCKYERVPEHCNCCDYKALKV